MREGGDRSTRKMGRFGRLPTAGPLSFHAPMDMTWISVAVKGERRGTIPLHEWLCACKSTSDRYPCAG